jgi:hypothetical protein
LVPSPTLLAGMPSPNSLTSPSTLPFPELDQTNFSNLNILDGRWTVPTRRTNNNIKYNSLPKSKMKTLNWTKVNNQYFGKFFTVLIINRLHELI